MNHPTPGTAHPGSPTGQPATDRKPVDEQVIEQRLAELASVDISEHAAIYEQLLGRLQQDLNQTGRGGQ